MSAALLGMRRGCQSVWVALVVVRCWFVLLGMSMFVPCLLAALLTSEHVLGCFTRKKERGTCCSPVSFSSVPLAYCADSSLQVFPRRPAGVRSSTLGCAPSDGLHVHHSLSPILNPLARAGYLVADLDGGGCQHA